MLILDKTITVILQSFDCVLVSKIRLAANAYKILRHQCQIHLFSGTHSETKPSLYADKSTVCNHSNAPSHPGLSSSLNPHLRFEPVSRSSMQVKAVEATFSASVQG